MSLREAISKGNERLDKFQEEALSRVNAIQELISLDFKVSDLGNEPTTAGIPQEIKNKLYVAVGLVVLGVITKNGIIAENDNLSTLSYLAAAGVAAYAGYEYMKTQKATSDALATPQTSANSGLDIIKLATEVGDKIKSLRDLPTEFDDLQIRNREAILKGIEKEVTDTNKKRDKDKLAFEKAVMEVSMSWYMTEINNAVNANDGNRIPEVLSEFKSNLKNAIKKAVQEQKDIYQKISE